jgi:uncharacterized membrane protein
MMFSREKLSAAGASIALLAFAALGAVELWRGEALPGLHPYPAGTPDVLVRALGALLLLFAAASQWRPQLAAPALALHWTVALAFVVVSVTANVADPTAYVPLAQSLVFAVFALSLWRASMRTALRLAFGAMLVLFGAIHFAYVDAIAGLIPDFVPAASLWPWLTGGAQVMVGIALLIGRYVWPGALAIAAMYVAWIPIVHAPRLAADTQSTFEWTFALTALALAGVALAIAGASKLSAARNPP